MNTNIDEYIENHSEKEPEYLYNINRRTHLKMVNPRMMSGHLQGRLLSLLSHMVQPECALELGTYSGYASLCIAEGMPENGILYTIEHNDEQEDFIRENLATSEYGKKIRLIIGDALEEIRKIDEVFDFVFIDADKRQYTSYFEAVIPKVRKGGFILADNTLWDGKVVEDVHPNDKQTRELIRFNELIANDERIEKIILPIRDGLTIMRKK